MKPVVTKQSAALIVTMTFTTIVYNTVLAQFKSSAAPLSLASQIPCHASVTMAHMHNIKNLHGMCMPNAHANTSSYNTQSHLPMMQHKTKNICYANALQ